MEKDRICRRSSFRFRHLEVWLESFRVERNPRPYHTVYDCKDCGEVEVGESRKIREIPLGEDNAAIAIAFAREVLKNCNQYKRKSYKA